VGKVDLLATVTNTGFDKAIAAANLFNTHFGHPETVLGAYQGPFAIDYPQDTYTSMLMGDYPHGNIVSRDGIQSASQAYLDTLSKQNDHSVTILSIGFPVNIRDALLADAELFEKKVKEIYWMGGSYNFGCGEKFIPNKVDCEGSMVLVQQLL